MKKYIIIMVALVFLGLPESRGGLSPTHAEAYAQKKGEDKKEDKKKDPPGPPVVRDKKDKEPPPKGKPKKPRPDN